MLGRRDTAEANSLLRDERGASAVEFVLVLGPLIMLVLGTINVALMVFMMVTVHFAVEDTARWAAIETMAADGVAPTATSVQAHGAEKYKGPGGPIVFTLDVSAPCGNLVNATADYNFTTGLVGRVIPISASACYPAG